MAKGVSPTPSLLAGRRQVSAVEKLHLGRGNRKYTVHWISADNRERCLRTAFRPSDNSRSLQLHLEEVHPIKIVAH